MIMILKEVKFNFFLKKNSIYFFLFISKTFKLFIFYYLGCLKAKKHIEKPTNKTIETIIPIVLHILLLIKHNQLHHKL